MLNQSLKDLKSFKQANTYSKEALQILRNKEVHSMSYLIFAMLNYKNLHKEIKVKEIVQKQEILILKIISMQAINLLPKRLYQKPLKLMKLFRDYSNLND